VLGLQSRAASAFTETAQVLVCVGDDGAVIPYSAAGELLSWQTSLGSDCASQGVADAHIWATGLVALTLSAQLFAVCAGRHRARARLTAVRR